MNVAMGFMVFLEGSDAREARKKWTEMGGAEQGGPPRTGTTEPGGVKRHLGERGFARGARDGADGLGASCGLAAAVSSRSACSQSSSSRPGVAPRSRKIWCARNAICCSVGIEVVRTALSVAGGA